MWAWSRWLHRKGLRRTARAVKFVNFLLYKCLLPAEAEVGRGVELKHYGLGTVIHANARIGDDVTIYHNVTIAGQSWIGSPHKVEIEEGVLIGVGSLIIPRDHQGLRIGRDSVIAPGAVVVGDVPERHLATGVPATVRPYTKRAEERAEQRVDGPGEDGGEGEG